MNLAAVQKILQEGTIINTRLDSGNAWYQNIVYKVNGKKVTIALLDSYIRNFVMSGSSMVLKYSSEYFEYLFEGSVADIVPKRPSFVTIQVCKAAELINTRAFPRYELNLPVYINSFNSEGPSFCITTNISLGGMAFKSRNSFDIGDEADVEIILPSNATIPLKGRIIRKSLKSNPSEYSMQFIEMDESNSNLLSECFALEEEKWINMKAIYMKEIKSKIK